MATQVTVTPISGPSIQVDWLYDNPLVGGGQTIIERGTSVGGSPIVWQQVGQVSGSTFVDSNVTSGVLYYYRVKKVEWSCYSPSAQITIV